MAVLYNYYTRIYAGLCLNSFTSIQFKVAQFYVYMVLRLVSFMFGQFCIRLALYLDNFALG